MILPKSLLLNVVFIFYLVRSTMFFNLEIKGFQSDKGKAFVEVLNEEGEVLTREVLSIVNKRVSHQIEIPAPGKYGVKVFHDENNNKKLDTNLVGYPTEAWGTSNDVRPTFRAPNLDEILVQVEPKSTIKISVR